MTEYKNHLDSGPGAKRGNNGCFHVWTIMVVLTILACGGFARLSQERQIAEIDRKITECRRAIENLRRPIENRRTELAGLENSRVVAFAASRGMKAAEPGQVCVMLPGGRAVESNVMVARRNIQTENRVSMANIVTKALP